MGESSIFQKEIGALYILEFVNKKLLVMLYALFSHQRVMFYECYSVLHSDWNVAQRHD